MFLENWYKFMSNIEPVVENGFEKITRRVVRNPFYTIGYVFIFVFLCATGIFNFRTVTGGEDLWTPQGSPIKESNAFRKKYYNPDSENGVVLLSDTNVIEIDAFNFLWDIFEDVTTITIDGLTYSDMCARNGHGRCVSFGPLQFWSQNRTLFSNTVHSLTDLQDAISVLQFPEGEFVNRDAIFGSGNYQVDDSNRIVGAGGMSHAIAVAYGTETQRTRWAGKFLDYMSTVQPNDEEPDVYYFSGRSIDDELAKSITGDVTLIVITYVVMIVFTCIVLSKKMNFVDSRIGLAFCGIFIIMLGVAAGYGFSAGCGVPFVSLHQILPFIVVGVGVDDILIMVASFDATNPKDSIEERLVRAMRSCGLSITYTTCTDVAAFLIGSSSALPAIQAFCFYAAFAMLFNFLFQITMFVALLSMDAQRMQDRRYDILFFVSSANKNSARIEPECSQNDNVGIEMNSTDGGNCQGSTSGQHDNTMEHSYNVENSVIKEFIHKTYAPMLAKPWVRLVIFVFFIVLTALGCFGASKASVGFDLIDLISDDSYARVYIKKARSMNLLAFEGSVATGIYFKPNTDYSNQQVQMRLMNVKSEFLEYRFNTAPVASWIEDFYIWLPTTQYNQTINSDGYLTNSSIFMSAVTDFVSEPRYRFYSQHIIFDSTVYEDISVPSEIITSRIVGFHSRQRGSMDKIRTMKHTRNYAKSIDVDPAPFAFSNQYLFTEAESLIVGEMLSNLVLALVAVFLITLIILVRPTAVLLVCGMLVLIDVDIIGSMYIWDLTVNTVTVVQMVMAVGLVVDYVSHVLHYYLKQPHSLTPDERMIEALTEIGPSVMMGCSTTLLGMFPLAFANSTIFRTFFRMFLSIIIFGAIHGLVLLPALMPLISFVELRNYAGDDIVPSYNSGDMSPKKEVVAVVANNEVGI